MYFGKQALLFWSGWKHASIQGYNRGGGAAMEEPVEDRPTERRQQKVDNIDTE